VVVALSLGSPTLFAPMQGIGAAGIRDVIAGLGQPGLICAPFIRITDQRPSAQWISKQVHKTSGTPLSVQLLGCHPEHMALATKVLVDSGADVVDLNLGCPTAKAMKKGVGAGLLGDLNSIARVIASMRAACPARLSVKIRALDSDPQDVMDLALMIQREGADFLTIHPRTQSQGYRGVADWSVVKRVKRCVTIPVVGNGDLWYAADALRLMQSTGVDAIMIGRAILRNPFLFRQFDELRLGASPFVPNGSDIVRYVRQLAEVARSTSKLNRSGPEGALKEHIQFLLRAVPEPARSALRQRTMRAGGISDVVNAIEPLADLQALDLAADGPLRFEMVPQTPSGEVSSDGEPI